MTDLEINKALALAIGWTENRRDENGCLDPDIAVFGDCPNKDDDEVKVWDGVRWRTFDYRDPTVIWPIAKRYYKFPRLCHGRWTAGVWITKGYATPEEAIAMAVIGGAK